MKKKIIFFLMIISICSAVLAAGTKTGKKHKKLGNGVKGGKVHKIGFILNMAPFVSPIASPGNIIGLAYGGYGYGCFGLESEFDIRINRILSVAPRIGGWFSYASYLNLGVTFNFGFFGTRPTGFGVGPCFDLPIHPLGYILIMPGAEFSYKYTFKFRLIVGGFIRIYPVGIGVRFGPLRTANAAANVNFGGILFGIKVGYGLGDVKK